MLKVLYLVSVSSIVVSSITLFQTLAIAQEYPDCFIINLAGKVNSLDRLCKRDESHKLRIVMKAHELYQQGFERGRRGLDIYKARGKSEIANMLLTPLQALQTEIQMDKQP